MFEVEEVRGETVELLGRLERLTAAVEQAEREGRLETAPASQANSCCHGTNRKFMLYLYVKKGPIKYSFLQLKTSASKFSSVADP